MDSIGKERANKDENADLSITHSTYHIDDLQPLSPRLQDLSNKVGN